MGAPFRFVGAHDTAADALLLLPLLFFFVCVFLNRLFPLEQFQWVVYDCETRTVQLLEEFSPRPFFLKMYLPYFDMFAQGGPPDVIDRPVAIIFLCRSICQNFKYILRS